MSPLRCLSRVFSMPWPSSHNWSPYPAACGSCAPDFQLDMWTIVHSMQIKPLRSGRPHLHQYPQSREPEMQRTATLLKGGEPAQNGRSYKPNNWNISFETRRTRGACPLVAVPGIAHLLYNMHGLHSVDPRIDLNRKRAGERKKPPGWKVPFWHFGYLPFQRVLPTKCHSHFREEPL